MEQIRDWVLERKKHASMNCLLLVVIGYAMKDGWLLDRYSRKAFTLEKLCLNLTKNEDLEGKPKLLILQQYVEGKLQARFI